MPSNKIYLYYICFVFTTNSLLYKLYLQIVKDINDFNNSIRKKIYKNINLIIKFIKKLIKI